MSSHTTEREYYLRRHRESLANAELAREGARHVHLELARRYAQAADALQAEPERSIAA